MILVSICSAEDVWSNDVNKYNTFCSQCTENPPFRFFWDTRYIPVVVLHLQLDPITYYVHQLCQLSISNAIMSINFEFMV